jgi:hypothetical protein
LLTIARNSCSRSPEIAAHDQRNAQGIVRLVKPFGMARVEAAATRALDIGARTYGSVRSILDNNLDRHADRPRGPDGVTILHPNIRGPRYYH